MSHSTTCTQRLTVPMILSIEIVSSNAPSIVESVSYRILGKLVYCSLRNACPDANGEHHGQLIPYPSAFAIFMELLV